MNQVEISGVFMGVEFSHETHKEKFYTGYISTKRFSGVEDVIPITISERLLDEVAQTGQKCTVVGEFRSYNKREEGKNRCILSVFVKSIEAPKEEDENTIQVEGYICKSSPVRTTPQGRRICDIVVATNRTSGKSDYLPMIVWGDRAEYISVFSIGTPVSVLGRIQSRVYQKVIDDEVIEKVAYEVSVLEIGKKEDIITEDEIEDLMSEVTEEE